VTPGWGGGVCEGQTCHDIGDNDFSIGRLDPGQNELVTVDFSPPMGSHGEGSCTVTVTSQGFPALTWSETYKVVTYGVPILLVDDDGGTDYQTYYQDALLASGHLSATWNLDSIGKLNSDFLDHFHIVVWETGENQPSVDGQDRAALASYLDNGGNLFLSGQDIGYDIFNTSGTQYGPDAQNWYRTYLGADYVMDDTNLDQITGVAADPIGDGLAFSISGGSGANNQLYPSEIEPTQGGVACFIYAADREAAVHKDNGTYQTVYFAFGFEGIAEATDRNTVMDRILDWVQIDLVGVPEGSAVTPSLVRLPTASPNPFNPSTHIEFELSGRAPTPLEINIYDLRGHKVRSLWLGPVLPGAQRFLWDGLSDSGSQVASGIYLAHVKLPDGQQTVKMTLAK
jgi:hypothetical protein